MGKQLVGALVMFVAIAFLIYFLAFVHGSHVGGADIWQIVAQWLINGLMFLVLFWNFFIGLKVFAAGLRQEWSGPPCSSGSGT